MAWITLHQSAGHYRIDLNYTVSDNVKGNYSDVTVNQIRYTQLDSDYYFWNYYGPGNTPSLGAVLGVSVNDERVAHVVTMGMVTGTKVYNVGPATKRIYHDANGAATVDIGAYSSTNTSPPYPWGNFDWSSVNVGLTKFDRNPATLNVKSSKITNTSITYSIKASKPVEKVYFRINGGTWRNSDLTIGENQTKTYTVNDLAPNTSYKIEWKATRTYNGVESYIYTTNVRTDADAPANTKIQVLSRTKTSIQIEITGQAGQNNPIVGYTYSLDGKTWSSYRTTGTITITGLQKNKTYKIYAKTKAHNNKTSATVSTTSKTLADPPTIAGIQVLFVKTRRLKVQPINYSAQAGIKHFIFRIEEIDKEITTNSAAEFTNLQPDINYTIKCTIVDIDSQTASTSIKVKTKADIPQNFEPIVSDITNSSFKIALPELEADLAEIIYHVDSNNYYSLDKSMAFSNLNNFTTYTVYIDITNDEGIKARSRIIQAKTLPAIPKFTIEIIKIKPREFTFNPVLIKNPGVNLAECYYTITSTNPDIKTDTLPQVVTGLKPNTKYQLYVKVIDKDKQYYITSIEVKTKEDKWVQISINGAPFQKYNTYLIFSNGEKKKIEKSKRKIII